MLFNSTVFVGLLLVTFLAYYRVRHANHQVAVLIIASACFYGYAQPVLLLLLVGSAAANACCSYAVLVTRRSVARWIAVAGVAFNLAVLASFKYGELLLGLFVDTSSDIDGAVSTLLLLPLPIGISFYTFQGISLVVDQFTDADSEGAPPPPSFIRHCRDTMFYIMFFPQLVAGPIVKARQFLPQIRSKRLADVDPYLALRALIVGYFLKSVVADNLKDQTFWMEAPYFTYQSTLTLVVLLVGYSCQIFADFAGYSLIAIGVAALFGYRLPKNFDFPYIAASIAEFWRRWHISLSSWLREYLYIGLLGGNRRGRSRTYANLVVVMFLGGLWHGAAWSYGVWGLWHGLGLAVERFLTSGRAAGRQVSPFARALRVVFVFAFVTIGWLFFKLPSFEDVLDYGRALYENSAISHNKLVLFNVALLCTPVAAYHALYLARQGVVRRVTAAIPFLLGAMLFLILVNGGIPGAFVYFQF